MDWANTHAPGMNSPHALYAFRSSAQGHYNPSNPGFWRRELLDARWAGLQFLTLNTFGPDLEHLPRLVEALDEVGGGIQISLFDDTWGWGKAGAPWASLPSFEDPEAAAQLIYQQKWRPFFESVPSRHWYRFQGRPFIYFYNAGTLEPQHKAAATLTRLKRLFAADYGSEPFLAVDRAFFADPATPDIADAQFLWNTFTTRQLSRSDMKGVKLAHFMPKWDSLGRDAGARDALRVATETDLIVKGPELLERYLAESQGADVAVIATWNDLGEGTGVSRNYDYYHRGQWLAPNAFMRALRSAQCTN
jgi:hypothetical protein